MEPPWHLKRTLVTRLEAETDSRFGFPPDRRPMEQHLRLGVINLDKHRGPTSHDVAATVRKMMGLSLVGHGGTLEVSGISRRLRGTAPDAGGRRQMHTGHNA